jgi:peptidoglycan/LPS O-acetylase OafA/YrhL
VTTRSSPAFPCSERFATRVAARTPARHIPSLDGIRAVSFLLVFAAHSGLNAIIVVGDFGVTIFFFLSGFLIATLLRVEFEQHDSINIRHFYLRRALRILPPFYLVLLAATLMALVVYPPGTVTGSSMAAELLFFENYRMAYMDNHQVPGTSVVWSLAVEEHFYLQFPWLYIGMQKWRLPRPTQAWFLWGLCAAVLAWRCVLVMAFHVSKAHILCATECRMDAILFGCALAVWNNPVLDPPRGSPGLWKYGLLPASLVALMLCLLLWHRPLFQQTLYFSIQGVALTGVFVCAIRFSTWPLFRVLNLRPVALIGTLSYSLYLVHEVLLRAIEHLWPRSHWSVREVSALAASVMAAWTIHVLIERPCALLRRRLTD